MPWGCWWMIRGPDVGPGARVPVCTTEQRAWETHSCRTRQAEGEGQTYTRCQTLFSTWATLSPLTSPLRRPAFLRLLNFFLVGVTMGHSVLYVLETGRPLKYITHVILIFLKLPTLYLNMHKDEHGLNSILENHSNLLFWNCLSYSRHWWLLTLNLELGERATHLLAHSKVVPGALGEPHRIWREDTKSHQLVLQYVFLGIILLILCLCLKKKNGWHLQHFNKFHVVFMNYLMSFSWWALL